MDVLTLECNYTLFRRFIQNCLMVVLTRRGTCSQRIKTQIWSCVKTETCWFNCWFYYFVNHWGKFYFWKPDAPLGWP